MGKRTGEINSDGTSIITRNRGRVLIPFSLLKAGGAMHYYGDVPKLSPSVAVQGMLEILGISELNGRHCLYDPFCGNGILLTTMAILFRDKIDKVIGSDISKEAVLMTNRNLARTYTYGISKVLQGNTVKRKRGEGAELPKKLINLCSFLERLDLQTQIPNTVFVHNALTERPSKIRDDSVTLLYLDPPYNSSCQWQNHPSSGKTVLSSDPLVNTGRALSNLRPLLRDDAVVGIILGLRGDMGHILHHTGGVDGYEFHSVRIPSEFGKTSRQLILLKAKSCS
jgi:16S rRNA G966 N2-methylase RsmD